MPRHRVIGADGSLTGFGGGLDWKRWLLRHEGAHAPGHDLQLSLRRVYHALEWTDVYDGEAR